MFAIVIQIHISNYVPNPWMYMYSAAAQFPSKCIMVLEYFEPLPIWLDSPLPLPHDII